MQHPETPIYINVHQAADFGGSSSHGQALISSIDSGSREYQLADPGHMLYNGSRSASTAIALSDEEFEEVGCHATSLDCVSFQHCWTLYRPIIFFALSAAVKSQRSFHHHAWCAERIAALNDFLHFNIHFLC